MTSTLTRSSPLLILAFALAAHAAPLDDARAAVFEGWRPYARVIWALQMGYSCDVLDQLSVSQAVLRVQVQMRHEQDFSGLASDSAATIELGAFTERALAMARGDAKNGACKKLTPGDRGRMRMLVGDLLRR